jgi:hypothetical protein
MRHVWRRGVCTTFAAGHSTESAREHVLRLTQPILRAVGLPSERRIAHRKGHRSRLQDAAQHEESVLEALSLFEAGVARGLALHDRETTSRLVQALCIPHAPWEGRQRLRALAMFDQ